MFLEGENGSQGQMQLAARCNQIKTGHCTLSWPLVVPVERGEVRNEERGGSHCTNHMDPSFSSLLHFGISTLVHLLVMSVTSVFHLCIFLGSSPNSPFLCILLPRQN